MIYLLDFFSGVVLTIIKETNLMPRVMRVEFLGPQGFITGDEMNQAANPSDLSEELIAADEKGKVTHHFLLIYITDASYLY